MELYPPSIKGDWIYVDGQKVFQFTDACFFGLQVLGDEVEPCFEGAAFFTLNDKVEKAFEKLKALEAAFELEEKGGKVTGSVSSKTDYLVCNDKNSTSTKMKKAKELNIPILSEKELLELCNYKLE